MSLKFVFWTPTLLTSVYLIWIKKDLIKHNLICCLDATSHHTIKHSNDNPGLMSGLLIIIGLGLGSSSLWGNNTYLQSHSVNLFHSFFTQNAACVLVCTFYQFKNKLFLYKTQIHVIVWLHSTERTLFIQQEMCFFSHALIIVKKNIIVIEMYVRQPKVVRWNCRLVWKVLVVVLHTCLALLNTYNIWHIQYVKLCCEEWRCVSHSCLFGSWLSNFTHAHTLFMTCAAASYQPSANQPPPNWWDVWGPQLIGWQPLWWGPSTKRSVEDFCRRYLLARMWGWKGGKSKAV